jgi:lipopolysaccharide/colanic/teichoic acid biosynthesis glycosyltransferase
LFGFIILRLCDMHGAPSQIKLLAKILHQRLRDTDEKGHLGPGRIGVLLPATDTAGTTLVLNQLLQLAHQHGLKIDGEAFVYPEQRDSQHQDKNHHDQQLDRPRHGEREKRAAGILPLAIATANYPVWKRMMDISGAALGLLLGSPILLICAVLVKLTSRGPILFRQKRTGYLGKEFTILKFRSMIDGAAELQSTLRERNERDGPAFKICNDPRTTFVGRLMRATGFDELPQLYNVLRGDMALVGPRPLPIHEADQCEPWQKIRVVTKPGLTCYWQISKSRKISFAQWMRLDIQYVRNVSLLLDVRLLAKTVVAVFLGRVGH